MADWIVELMMERPEITTKEIAEVVGITTAGMQYHIKKLKASGCIERVGADKGGYWKVKITGI